MKIGIIGIGKLGLCFGLNLKKAGHEVYGVDNNIEYVEKLKLGTFNSTEDYVNEYLTKYGFNYSINIDDALSCDIIFVVVQTPSTNDFKYDHSIIESIKDELIQRGKSSNRKDLIINCTTFPGYCDGLQKDLDPFNYRVSYNPEFIAQGTIIRDQQYCDNVLIGQADEFAGNLIKEIYNSFVLSTPIFNTMSLTEAEITKLSVNCFLTTKISYANMIGDIAIRYKANPYTILNAVGTDSRIGGKYLKPGFGFGGPCFPRDNRALAKCAEEVGIDAIISKATDEMNKSHLENQINFIKESFSKEDVIEIEYLTFKKESDSFQESQQLEFAKRLQLEGFRVRVKDEREEIVKIANDKYGIKSI